MWQNPQETADLVTYTEEILNGKLHFLCNFSFFCWEAWFKPVKLWRNAFKKLNKSSGESIHLIFWPSYNFQSKFYLMFYVRKSLFRFYMSFLSNLCIHHSKGMKELAWLEGQFNSTFVMEDWNIFSCGVSFTH